MASATTTRRQHHNPDPPALILSQPSFSLPLHGSALSTEQLMEPPPPQLRHHLLNIGHRYFFNSHPVSTKQVASFLDLRRDLQVLK